MADCATNIAQHAYKKNAQIYCEIIYFICISYFKHIYTRYKFNKSIVLQCGPVQMKVPKKLFTNELQVASKKLFHV